MSQQTTLSWEEVEVGDIIFLIVFNSHLPALYSKFNLTRSQLMNVFLLLEGVFSPQKRVC